MDPFQSLGRERSQLFLVRLWAEEATEGNDSRGSEATGVTENSGGQIEWCGKVQDVVSGQAYYFRGWPTLIDLLLEMSRAE